MIKDRGQYCRAFLSCGSTRLFQINPDVCISCTAFIPIFHDPAKLPQFGILPEPKICTKCHKPKAPTKKYFYAAKNNKADGLSSWCKVCVNDASKAAKKLAQAKKDLADLAQVKADLAQAEKDLVKLVRYKKARVKKIQDKQAQVKKNLAQVKADLVQAVKDLVDIKNTILIQTV